MRYTNLLLIFLNVSPVTYSEPQYTGTNPILRRRTDTPLGTPKEVNSRKGVLYSYVISIDEKKKTHLFYYEPPVSVFLIKVKVKVRVHTRQTDRDKVQHAERSTVTGDRAGIPTSGLRTMFSPWL